MALHIIGYTSIQRAYKNVFNLDCISKMQIKTTVRCYDIPPIPKIKRQAVSFKSILGKWYSY